MPGTGPMIRSDWPAQPAAAGRAPSVSPAGVPSGPVGGRSGGARAPGPVDARRAGACFDIAWPMALAEGVAASGKWDRTAWRNALAGTRPAWERAFSGEPATVADRAASVLLGEGTLGRGEAAGAVSLGGCVRRLAPAGQGGAP